MAFGLKDETVEKIIRVLKTFPQINRTVVYGSRAKGNYKNGSDIDITLFGKELSGELLYKIRNDFEELNLPYKIDVSIFDDIDNQNLKDHILRVGKELYRQS